MTTNSQVTHSLIASQAPGEDVQLLGAGDPTNGLGLMPIAPEKGEIFLVLTHEDPTTISRINPIISRWHKEAQTAMQQRRANETLHRMYKFPELKCQAASLIGLFVVIHAYLGNPVTVRNPFANQTGVFCSELIDEIFKEADILVSPRSEHNAVIGPVELLYSPLFSLKGVIADEHDLAHAQSEIKKQFFSQSPS